MRRREVASVTIEYKDGSVETFKEENMFHKAGLNYPGGANPKAEDAFTTHEVIWSDPKPIQTKLI